MENKDAIREEFRRIDEQKELIQRTYNQLNEIIEEVENAQGDLYVKREDAYSSMLGLETMSIFFKKKKEDILKELQEKKELLDFNLKTLDKRLQELREKLQS
ncbi:MAG: hypothetical protein OH318_00775 [Candidatus Parvarchaeota archaeon]|nr:hypothetical protein [Candidatus Rehaiarchaeum fermentans]